VTDGDTGDGDVLADGDLEAGDGDADEVMGTP
jgi:hypothetical protein